MTIVFLIFDGLTALDAIGPYEVLSHVPGVRVQFVAPEAGPVRSDTGALTLVAEAGMADVRQADILVVPGGFGVRRLVADERVLDWLRAMDATTRMTVSVCNGALLLAAAGLLAGRRANTHWAMRDQLASLGAVPVAERTVRDGKYACSAGVSAGIDLALVIAAELAGEDAARAIQLGLEYDPRPPFDAGSPETAPAHLVALLRAQISSWEAEPAVG